ncbi:MAG TPA: hypothetical protein VGR98_27980 [Streptosporangiaceae bacterium]|nr:hypothetical protein [Streptosporangiaceae bacterium]
MAGGVDGVALGAVAAGGLFLYAGLKGYSIPHALQAVISSKSPAASPVLANQIAPLSGAYGAPAGSPAGSPATGGAPGTASPTAPAGAPSVSGNYSHAQLMQLWQSVGGSAAAANNAACHAIQESSGRPGVTSPNPDGGTNVGLWQLDTPGGKGAGYSIAQLQNPVVNARVAVQGSSNGTDWSAWATPGC